MKLAIRTVLLCLLFTLAAWAQDVQVSASYLCQGSNRAPGATDWFAANGGRADLSVGQWRHFKFVAEVAGEHTSNLTSSGQGQTTFTYMAGPRREVSLGRGERPRTSFFAQILCGGVHGSDGLFPGGSTVHSSANAFAMSAGGGLNVALHRGVSLRLLQVDYLYTGLPNFHDNYQSSFRLGAGVAFRIH